MQLYTSRIALLTATIFLSIALQAQVNSPYSRFGLGNLHQTTFEAANGFAGISAPFFTTTNINFGNPASYADLSYAIFDVGARAEILNLQTVEERYTGGDGNLSHIAFGFPFLKKLRNQKFGLSFGLIPYSSFQYDIIEESISEDEQLGTISNNYVGSGDLYQFYGGAGYKVTTDTTIKARDNGDTSSVSNSFSIGGNFSYLFGSLTTRTYASFPDQVNSQTTKLLRENRVGGYMYNFGIGIQHLDFRNKEDLFIWRIGAAMQPQITVDGLQSVLWTNILKSGNYEFTTDTLYIAPDTSGSITLPATYRAGVSFSFLSTESDKNQFSIFAEYVKSNWSDYRGFQSSGTLTDNYRVSIGAEFIPATDNDYKLAPVYRIGFYSGTSYLTIDGEQLGEFGFSVGFGIPIAPNTALRNSKLNISAGVGTRGTTDTIKETMYHIGIGFTLVDSGWFQKYKLN